MDMQALSQFLQNLPAAPDFELEEVTLKFKTVDRILTDVSVFQFLNLREADGLLALDLRVGMDGLSVTFCPNPNPTVPEEQTQATGETAELVE